MKLADMEVIDWKDHVGGGEGWLTIEELAEDNKPHVVRSVGWVVVEGEDALTIVSHGNLDSESDEYQGAMIIVKSAIVSRTKPFAVATT